MFKAATLHCIVPITWETQMNELTCDVAVTYEHNGADHFEVLDADILDNPDGDVPYGIREDIFDALVDAAVIERCAEDYGDWLSGQDGQED
jgi:hypothetical protein